MQTDKYQRLYHTFFESYSIHEQILIHEHNYQQLSHTSIDYRSNQEQTLRLHCFLEQLHTFLEPCSDQECTLLQRRIF